MTNINDLVQEFWRTSSGGVIGASISAMRHLFKNFQRCYVLKVCFDITSVFATAVDFAYKIYRCLQTPIHAPSRTLTTESEPNLRYCLKGIERC